MTPLYETIVAVQWWDALGQEGPLMEHEIENGRMIFTVGHLVREDENTVVVALDRYETGEWQSVIAIPRAYIRNMEMIS